MARPYVSTALLAALGFASAPISLDAQAPQTFNACYVPSVGAIYLISRTGLPTACLAQGHVPVTWTDGGALADGAVTTVKLADGAVTAAKLGFDPATQAELDAHAAALGSAGTVNDPANPMDWTRLKGMPAGFADGVDNGETFTASQGVTLSAGTDIQLAPCAATQVWKRNVSATAWECAADLNSGGTVTSITAGEGLLGGTIIGAGTVSVNFAGPGAATTVARSDHTHATAAINSTAVGIEALAANTTVGQHNTAVGAGALKANLTGTNNTAVGTGALFASTGSNNLALGASAGRDVTTGSLNIHIGNPGLSTDDATIRIGSRLDHTQTFIAGISGATSAAGTAVFVNTLGQLGTLTSSARFKEGVEDLGDTGQRLLRLRPVRFRYKPEYDDGSRLPQYGLIAEEVADVFPELVAFGRDGQPETVRYHLFPALLLNELQRQERELEALRAEVATLRALLERLGL